ncbi:MAG: DUF6079 family protein [Dehalobacter sp.]|nr:DUF6079 family protein [Dehalobacter sp.]
MIKYGDLFQLNPIETIIKLTHADEQSEAKRLVSSFVVTPSLAKSFIDVILPQLTFSKDHEKKGIFVVGNYGTGKSHVMSFVSILAENAGLLDHVMDPDIRNEFVAIAGKYIVRRTEIGGSQMNLYGIVTHELSMVAKQLGFSFEWQPLGQIVNVKEEFRRFMQAFEDYHPTKGLLLVIDELLHYLETRDDQALQLDLSVLRAIGEFCDESRFVFIAGLQQALFNNPRFSFVAKSVNRVKQRFEDLLIVDRNVFELAEQYLFRKTGQQRDQIRDLLKSQFRLFEKVAPDIERFISVFPAHPNFIDEFQRVHVVERREILTTLTREARVLLDTEVDPANLILITTDKYWPYVENDESLNTNQTVKTLKKHVATICHRIEDGFGLKEDKKAAVRLINALAVNRMTTANPTDPVGLTSIELKNNLLWRTSIPIDDAEFLTGAAKRLLELTRSVNNGQFLAVAENSGQYYIDPSRDKDYEQDIRNYSKTLSREVLQRYLNEIVLRTLLLDAVAPVQEGRLWDYALLWPDNNVERPGWLFFGFPNQRSTAYPPRDFYIFFIPSKRITGREDNCPDNVDEVYCFLEDFPAAKIDRDEALRLSDDAQDTYLDKLAYYAAARELQSNSAGLDRQGYEQEAKRKLERIVEEFHSHVGQWISLRFNGQKRTLEQWITEQAPARLNAPLRSQIDALTQGLLRAHFENKYPDYPIFTERIYENTRSAAAISAIEIICGVGQKTAQGKSVLRALALMDGDLLTAEKSPWLKLIMERLEGLPPGQVLNQSDLFEKREERIWLVGTCLEAEWVHVTIAAGIEAGFLVVIGPNNQKYDATVLKMFYQNIRTWQDIIRIARPASVPIQTWHKLFKVLGCNVGLLANPASYAEAIQVFQTRLTEIIPRLVELSAKLPQTLQLASEPARQSITNFTARLEDSKNKFEPLQSFNSRAKMVNLRLDDNEIATLRQATEDLTTAEQLNDFITEQRPYLSAIERYKQIHASDETFVSTLMNMEMQLNDVYCQPDRLKDQNEKDQLTLSIRNSTNKAFALYRHLHKQHSLDTNGDQRKRRLLEGPQLKRLNKLVNISVINRAGLDSLRQDLAVLGRHHACTDEELLSSPTGLCPTTKFDPRILISDIPALERLTCCEAQAVNLENEWTAQLLRELEDPAVQNSLLLVYGEEVQRISDFRAAKRLPDTVDDIFINAINTVLRGLRRRTVSSKNFAESVLGGAPLRPEEVRKRFDKWLESQIGQEKPETVRIVLED